MAFVAAGLTFTSCDNKAKAPAPEEETTVIEGADEALINDANAAADEIIAGLTDNIEKKDVSAIETALNTVKEKVSEFLAKNPEVAKEFLTKVQSFIAENKEKITAVIGGNAAVASLMDGITAIPSETVEQLTGATDALKALGIDVLGKTTDAVEGAKDSASDAVDNAKDAAAGAVENVKDAAAGAVESTKDAANKAVNDAKEKAGDAVDKAAGDAKKALGL